MIKVYEESCQAENVLVGEVMGSIPEVTSRNLFSRVGVLGL